MSSPESRRNLAGGAELDAARGTLREALGALRNFAELLHSLKVGSKALISVLPDVAAGCAPMRDTLHSLLGAVEGTPGMTDATQALREYFAPRLAQLDQVLAEAAHRPFSAKSRLGLEHVITRMSLELDTARGLLDLLLEAASGPTLEVDLAELVQQSFAGPPSGGSWNRERLSATLSCVRADVEVELNPRIATALVALGIELVARGSKETPHVRVDRDEHGQYQVEIDRSRAVAGEDLVLIARGVIEPTLICVRAVAGVCGMSLAWHEDRPSLRFTFPDRKGNLHRETVS